MMENENTSENVEAIEEEKEDYLDEHPEEDIEVEEIEFGLSESEIEEWISELNLLKESKGQITLSVDEETDLKINYSEEDEAVEDAESEMEDGE